MTTKGQFYKETTEVLDGRTYENCEFTNCNLVYRGGTLPILNACKFDDCRFTFEDAADRTLNCMKMFYNCLPGGGKQLVETFFNGVRQSVPGGGAN
jgi:hypothetical protein